MILIYMTVIFEGSRLFYKKSSQVNKILHFENMTCKINVINLFTENRLITFILQVIFSKLYASLNKNIYSLK